MFNLAANIMLSGDITWDYVKEMYEADEIKEYGLKISFNIGSSSQDYNKRQAIRYIKYILGMKEYDWISSGLKDWEIDLYKMKSFFSEINFPEWFKGIISIEPEVESSDAKLIRNMQTLKVVAFYITPELVKSCGRVKDNNIPVEITESIKRFKYDHPDSTRNAFIMMKFGKTTAHTNIIESIRDTLSSIGFNGLRADDKGYHEDLFYNVLTYIYGCDLGIAVFERIEKDDFNPNVSLK